MKGSRDMTWGLFGTRRTRHETSAALLALLIVVPTMLITDPAKAAAPTAKQLAHLSPGQRAAFKNLVTPKARAQGAVTISDVLSRRQGVRNADRALLVAPVGLPHKFAVDSLSAIKMVPYQSLGSSRAN